MDAVVENSEWMIRHGSKSFSAAARLFDPVARESARLLYAWCRHLDDVIDGQHLGFSSEINGEKNDAESRFIDVYEKTCSVLLGDVIEDPPFIALQRVVRRHHIPDQYPLDLLRGFAMDVVGAEYRTLEDVVKYSYHVAGVVGVMMTYVMGGRGGEPLSEKTIDRASDYGIAMQLTNISRDVMDDAIDGRVYLPSDWLKEEGVTKSNITDPKMREKLSIVVARLLAEADRYYESGRHGISSLPPRAAWAVASAGRVYRDIGRAVNRLGERAWDRRVSIGRTRKLSLIARGAFDAFIASRFAVRSANDATTCDRNRLWSRPKGIESNSIPTAREMLANRDNRAR